MKVMTILGTRPEIIRLSLIIKKLHTKEMERSCEHILVHTGQNAADSLSNIFFQELKIREADYYLGVRTNSFGGQVSQILSRIEDVLKQEKPDKVLILGDTNSGLSAIIAERMGIPVFHMEAGNRCFDLKVPEESNRKIIDTIATFNLPYTPGSRENLLLAGIEKKRIFLTGNPIYEVLNHYRKEIEHSQVIEQLELTKKEYILVTIHRAENVDLKERLTIIINAIKEVQQQVGLPVVFSVHPRTKDKIRKFKLLTENSAIYCSDPFGFFDFVKLEQNAALVLTDSGTVQEECCLFNVPTVTVRDSTERPETVECGSNLVSGIQYQSIIQAARIMIAAKGNWEYPVGYTVKNVSDRVINLLFCN